MLNVRASFDFFQNGLVFSSTLRRLNSCHQYLQDDPEAHDRFLLINRAYETLKDPDLRKRYDLFGEEGGSGGRQRQYQSWSYYHDNFGIYDDDAEIVTLDRAEFGRCQAVMGDLVDVEPCWVI